VGESTHASAAVPGLAERLLEVIDSGRRTATYKLALLMALLDLCALRSDRDGSPPDVLYTREIAERIAAIYWPQVLRYRRGPEAIDLRQITNPRSAITEAVRRFRQLAEASQATSIGLARQRLPDEYSAMIDTVEATVAKEPLPRLQTVGSSEHTVPFLYDLDWSTRESFSPRRLRAPGPQGLPVRLRPGAARELVRLAPLIRPLIELHWTRMVAELNQIAREEENLSRHLFGRDRVTPPRALREGLADLQAGQCFYCAKSLGRTPEADHFIPRVRCGIDAVENLVLADPQCNNDKRDLLPAIPLVTSWADRNTLHKHELASLASASNWDSDYDGTAAIARSIYRHLPSPAPLWSGRRRVEITHVPPEIILEITRGDL
jgi:5-methylcytosine-specific restriction endonuclease McrA